MVVIPPGFLINVQVPLAGKPFNITLPAASAQVGCVIVPIVGAMGETFILTAAWAVSIPHAPDAAIV